MLLASFFDRSGTTFNNTLTNQTEDIFTVTKMALIDQQLKLRLSKLFNAFPTEVTGLHHS